MKKSLYTILFLVLSVLPALAVYAVGDQVGNISCVDWNGNPWDLNSQSGKVVLINFGANW
jgi:hypothetical protein